MIKLFLLFVAAILVPPALSYGIDPAAVLPKSMAITVEGTDQIEMLRAIMGLYFGTASLPPSPRPGDMSPRSGLCSFSTRSRPAASSA